MMRPMIRISRRGRRGITAVASLAAVLVFGSVAVARDQSGQRPADGTPMVAVDLGDFAGCGIRPTGRLVCWANDPGDLGSYLPRSLVEPPTGPFAAVSTGGDSSACGIQKNGRLTCWGADPAGLLAPPTGRFTALGVGWSSACAIRTDQRIVCWGLPSVMAPDGTFVVLAAGQDVYCAIRTDGSAVCWGDPENLPFAGGYVTPGGTFTGVGVTAFFRPCGIRPDASLECWGDMPTNAPDGRYAQADTNYGLLVDGTVVSWPESGSETGPPSGRFSSISGQCGIRVDDTLDCWGLPMPATDTLPFALDNEPLRWTDLLLAVSAGLLGAIAVLRRPRDPARL
jgi:hypothetical protein